jgi:hypothetical protein
VVVVGVVEVVVVVVDVVEVVVDDGRTVIRVVVVGVVEVVVVVVDVVEVVVDVDGTGGLIALASSIPRSRMALTWERYCSSLAICTPVNTAAAIRTVAISLRQRGTRRGCVMLLSFSGWIYGSTLHVLSSHLAVHIRRSCSTHE